jgi:DNA-binding NtrC family response regulator
MTAIAASEAARILVLEDDLALSEVFYDELAGLGHAIRPARSLADGVAALKSAEYDVALLDVVLPDGSGVDLLRQIVADALPTEGIVLTDAGEVGTAMEAMRLGAYAYLTKPARLDELTVLVARAAEKSRLRREVVALRSRLDRQPFDRQQEVSGLLTRDPRMQEVLERVGRVGLTLAEVEREYIETVLKLHDGHRGRAARALGIDPKTLYNKLGAARPRSSRTAH